MLTERLLGFGVRRPPEPAEEWSAERRSAFLLRDDVAAPLSTDENVWPAAALPPRGDLGAPPFPGLWARVGPAVEAAGGAWIVAVTRVGATDEEIWWQPSPGKVHPSWTRLGYDVSDAALLSGLTNCGYGQERDALRAEWGTDLNEFHLFHDTGRADAFRAVRDRRVAEHAPFFVHGLYRVSPA